VNQDEFSKSKEVIVKNRPKNINLFHFSHRCHGLGDSKESLSPIFSVFMISCLRHVFVTRISASWR
jgi:phosphoribosyl 1,2-cyclic phosphodiesterase